MEEARRQFTRSQQAQLGQLDFSNSVIHTAPPALGFNNNTITVWYTEIVYEPLTQKSQVPQIYFDGGPLDGTYKDYTSELSEIDCSPPIMQATIGNTKKEVLYELVGKSDNLYVYLYKETLDTTPPRSAEESPSCSCNTECNIANCSSCHCNE